MACQAGSAVETPESMSFPKAPLKRFNDPSGTFWGAKWGNRGGRWLRPGEGSAGPGAGPGASPT